jgi:hypothetical protein
MEDTWVNIFSTSKAYQAEVAKDILFDEGIASVIINKQDTNYLFGEVELYVERDDAILAKHILEKANITF